MGYYDNFLRLCARDKITPAQVQRDLGLSKAAANKWKSGSIPHDATLMRVAEYFGVTTDELLGIENAPTPEGADAKQIINDLQTMAEDGTLLYSGEPLDPTTARLFMNALNYIDKLLEDQTKNDV